MKKAMKRLSIVTVFLGLVAASMMAALAQEAADPHHPTDPAAAGASAPQALPAQAGVSTAPMQGGSMMGGDQMRMMKMMQEMHEMMMGGGVAMQPKGDTGPSSQAFTGIMANMHQEMAITFTGNADVDFVKGMIPHHKAAVDMAKTVLAFGKDPDVRKVAEGVIKAQEAEIIWMKAWLENQGQ